MAGRKSKVDIDALYKILEQEKTAIFEGGFRIPGPTNECWNNIAKLYGPGISPKYIYTILQQRRYGIADKLGLNPTKEGEEEVLTEDDVLEQDEVTTNEDDNSGDEANLLRFKITLSSQEWEKLYLECEYFRGDRHANRRYEVLKPNEWTTIMNEHFHALSKCSCCIVFKRCTLTPNGAAFLRFQGYCKSCNSQLCGVIDALPREHNRVVVECTYSGDYQMCKTSRKRRIIGQKKEEYLSKMLVEKKSASFIQKEEATKLMQYGDPEPTHLPSLNALRVMKYKSKTESRLDKDPILAILQLKSCVPYSEMIREVGYDHFYVHYWTTFQINNYRVYARNTTVPCISIDATGSLVTPINLTSGRKTNSIFLYEIAVLDNLKKVQFSVGEMLSEAHDNNSIAYWLSKWAMNRIPLPKIVVLDMSRALMMACVKSFTQYSTLAKYLEVCWSLLCGKNDGETPNCMLRNDFAHIMHLISGWPEIKNTESRRIRRFYLHTFALLISATDWNDAKLLLQHIFTISVSETEGLGEDGEETPCLLAIEFLKQRIAGISPEMDILVDENTEIDDPDEIRFEEDSEGTFHQENVRQIYERCCQIANDTPGDHDNPFFKPKIAQRLIKLCELLPVWSAVMVPIFGFGNITQSSTASESLFKELKKDAFQHEKLPMRLDTFIEKHLNFIEGATVITSSKYVEEVKEKDTVKPKKFSEKVIIDEDETLLDSPKIVAVEFAEENWRGQNLQSTSAKTRKTYLDIDKTVLHQKLSKAKCSSIGLILNGNVIKLNSVKIGDYCYSFTNTCAFDSIAQVEFVAYADSEIYATYINNYEQELVFFELIKHGVTDGVTAQLYRRRALIYTKIFEDLIKESIGKGIINNCNNVSTNTTTRWLLAELFLSRPSIIEQRVCNWCTIARERREVVLLINLITDNLNFFTEAIVTELTRDVLCDFCGKLIPREGNCQIDLAPHLFIEVATSEAYMKQVNDDLQTTLSAVPTTFNVLGKNYFLRGLISFHGPTLRRINSVGHYIAYCYRSNGVWEKYDDLSTSIRAVRPTTAVQVQHIFYSL